MHTIHTLSLPTGCLSCRTCPESRLWYKYVLSTCPVLLVVCCCFDEVMHLFEDPLLGIVGILDNALREPTVKANRCENDDRAIQSVVRTG